MKIELEPLLESITELILVAKYNKINYQDQYSTGYIEGLVNLKRSLLYQDNICIICERIITDCKCKECLCCHDNTMIVDKFNMCNDCKNTLKK